MNQIFGSLSVRVQLLAGFGFLLALMLMMSIMTFTQMSSIEQQTEQIASRSIGQLIAVGRLQSANLATGNAVRDIVSVESVAGQKEATAELKAALKNFQQSLGDTQQAGVGADAERGTLIKTIADDFKAITPMIDEVLVMVDEANIDHARSFVFENLRPKQVALSARLEELVKLESAKAQKSAAAAQATFSRATRLMVLILLAGLSLGGLLAWGVTNGIVRALRIAVEFAADVAGGDFSRRVQAKGDNEMAELLNALNGMAQHLSDTVAQIRRQADRTAGYAHQLSADSQSARDRSQTQVDSIMSITAAMEQMSVSIREVSNHAEAVSGAANRTQALSLDGNDKMAHNRSEIQEIERLVDVSGTVIGELSTAIAQIGEITKVIQDIANQTNLLALNAAIEAARAGEQGRGFAVVADEVRKLAERTAQSTTEIASMLATVGGKAGETVAAMREVHGAVERGAHDTDGVVATLQEIVAAASEVSTLVGSIAVAMEEQAKTTETTAQSVEAISAVTEETNGTIERVKETAGEMNAVSTDLQQLVSKFRISN